MSGFIFQKIGEGVNHTTEKGVGCVKITIDPLVLKTIKNDDLEKLYLFKDVGGRYTLSGLVPQATTASYTFSQMESEALRVMARGCKEMIDGIEETYEKQLADLRNIIAERDKTIQQLREEKK